MDNINISKRILNNPYTVFFLFILFVLLFFYNSGYIRTTGVWLITTKSISEDGDVDLINNISGPPEEHMGAIIRVGKRAVGKFPIGRGLFYVPFYYPIYHLIKILPQTFQEKLNANGFGGDWIIKQIATFLNILATAFGALFVLLIIIALLNDLRSAVFGGLAYALGSSIFSFTSSPEVEPMASALVGFAILNWINFRAKNNFRNILYAYISLTVATTLSPQVIFILIIFIAYHIVHQELKPFLTGIISGSIALFFFFLTNYISFGSLLKTGYSTYEVLHGFGASIVLLLLCIMLYIAILINIKQVIIENILLQISLVLLLFAIIIHPMSFWEYTISPIRGILIYSPAFILTYLGMKWLIVNKPSIGKEMIVSLIIVLATLSFYGVDRAYILTRYAAPFFTLPAVFSGVGFFKLKYKSIGYTLLYLGMAIQFLITVDNIYNQSELVKIINHNIKNVPSSTSFTWIYSPIRYKLIALLHNISEIPQFISNSNSFDNTLFFNNYWFIVFIQEVPILLIIIILMLLITSIIYFGVLLKRFITVSEKNCI